MIRSLLFLPILFFATSCERRSATQIVISPEPSVEGLVATVLQGGDTFRDVSFAELVEISTGRRVLPMSPGDPADAEILAVLGEAFNRVLERFNAPDSITHQEDRINEVSRYFETALIEEIDKTPELECTYPRTAEGNLQRAGYPDLMVRHPESGRIAYLDPKLVKEGSLQSDLRTFYFTPSVQTRKVLYDASHLLVGIEHDGHTGKWKYLRWHLVDLSGFRVRLKAEFQASNEDLYRPGMIIRTGEAP